MTATDLQALMAAVRENVGDSLARLALADAYEEDGNEDMAEVQRELAGLGCIKQLGEEQTADLVDDFLDYEWDEVHGGEVRRERLAEEIKVVVGFDEDLLVYWHQVRVQYDEGEMWLSGVGALGSLGLRLPDVRARAGLPDLE